MHTPFAFVQLRRLILEWRPDVVQSWMYHADLLAALVLLTIPRHRRPKLAWNIRHSDLPGGASSKATRAVVALCARLSHKVPDVIVTCAGSAAKVHVDAGYRADRMEVIPNGVSVPDIDRQKARAALVREFPELPPDAILVGRVGRLHPQKDYPSFLKAANLLARDLPEVHFLLVGRGLDRTNELVVRWVQQAELSGQVHLLGQRSDVLRITAALDVACSSSSAGEAFPNVVAEALALGIPVVGTNSGDTAEIIGNAGIVVPPRNPESLAAGIAKLVNLAYDDRVALGRRGQARMHSLFSTQQMVQRYTALYQRLTQ